MNDRRRLSIAELISSGEPPQPAEAVAIILEVCAQVASRAARPGVAPAVSAAGVLIDASGTVIVAGGAPGEDDQTVSLLGYLLLGMLKAPSPAGRVSVPPALHGLAVRAAAAGPEPFGSVAQFAAAIRRYGPAQNHVAIREVFTRWLASAGGQEIDVGSAAAGLGVASAESPRPAPHAEAGSGPVSTPFRITPAPRPARVVRAMLVAVALLFLAGAGAAFWLAASASPASPPGPLLRRAPAASPRHQPDWELLSQPGRGATKSVQADPSLSPDRHVTDRSRGGARDRSRRQPPAATAQDGAPATPSQRQ
jgi:hypothetical protein